MPYSYPAPAWPRPARGLGEHGRLSRGVFGLAGSALVTLLVGCAQQDAGVASSLPTFTGTSSPAGSSPAGSAPSPVLDPDPAAAASGPGSASASGSPAAADPGASTAGSAPSAGGSPGPLEVPAPARSAWAALPVETSGPDAGLRTGTVLTGKQGRTSDERAALAAVRAYWELLSTAYRRAAVRRPELAKVMLPEPASAIEKSVAGLRSRAAHTIGWTVVDVRLIGVVAAGKNTGAAVSGCGVDASMDVDDASGRPLQPPTGEFTMDAGVRRVGSKWLVSSMRLTAGPCVVPG